MIIYVTAVNDDFSTNIPFQGIVLFHMVQKLRVTAAISPFISELPFRSSKKSRFLFFLLFFLFFFRQVCIMQNIVSVL